MSAKTIDTQRFIERVERFVSKNPTRFPDMTVAKEIDTETVAFARTIQPGTKAGDLPQMFVNANKENLKKWIDKLVAEDSEMRKFDLPRFLAARALFCYTEALRAQWVIGRSGRESAFT